MFSPVLFIIENFVFEEIIAYCYIKEIHFEYYNLWFFLKSNNQTGSLANKSLTTT